MQNLTTTSTATYISNHLNNVAPIEGNEILEDSTRATSAIIRLSNGQAFSYTLRYDVQAGTPNLNHNIGGWFSTGYAASATHAAIILAATLRKHYA